jgi:hypothetical protein
MDVDAASRTRVAVNPIAVRRRLMDALLPSTIASVWIWDTWDQGEVETGGRVLEVRNGGKGEPLPERHDMIRQTCRHRGCPPPPRAPAVTLEESPRIITNIKHRQIENQDMAPRSMETYGMDTEST